MASEQLRVKKVLPEKDVSWSKVRSVLESKYKKSPEESTKLVLNFKRRASKPVTIFWILNRELPSNEAYVAAALCHAHDCDAVTVLFLKTLFIVSFTSKYRHSLTLTPKSANDSKKDSPYVCCNSVYQLEFYRLIWSISSIPQVLLFHTAAFFLVTFVVILGGSLFLYSFAVFAVFVLHPKVLTQLATKNHAVGLALLCFLTLLVGLFRKAVFNLVTLARQPKGDEKHF